MGRYPRIEGRSLVYYVSTKGREGQPIFKDNKDKVFFKNLLKLQQTKSKLTFYGYILLPSLYACLMETSRNNFIQSMHNIHSSYANYFNRRHNCGNKLFHDRYTCYIIEKKPYLLAVSRYLHLLPAKREYLGPFSDYAWSSLPGYIQKDRMEDWIDYDSILRMLHRNIHTAAFAYQEYMKEGIKKDAPSPFEALKEGIILGSDDFKAKVCKSQRPDDLKKDKEEILLAKRILQMVNQNSPWPSLKAKRKRLQPAKLSRNAAIYFLKRFTNLSNQQISHFFHSLQVSSISQMSRRFQLEKKKHQSLRKISNSLESKIRKTVLDTEKDAG
jgi:hypothetical protein